MTVWTAYWVSVSAMLSSMGSSARAFASNPNYLMLDEPFEGVEPILISYLQNMISNLRYFGLGLLVRDHNVRATSSIDDRADIIVGGKILAHGTPAEVAANEQVRHYYLGDCLDQPHGPRSGLARTDRSD